MSADNYYVIHEVGGEYVIVQGFASDDEYPTPSNSRTHFKSESFDEALDWCEKEYAEYGYLVELQRGGILMTEFSDRWWEVMIAGIAYETSRKDRFKGVVGHDEIQGALWEWKLRADRPRKPTKRNPDGLSRIALYIHDHDPDDFERLIANILREEAALYARRERAAQFGYSVEDEFFYTLPALKSLMEQVFDHEAWLDKPAPDASGGHGGRPANEGGNWIATLADVSQGIGRLSKDDQDLLHAAFKGGGLARNDIADGLGLSRRGVEHRIEAAIKRLWNQLGGPRWMRDDEDEEYVGTRHAISNAHARLITEEQYA